MIDKIAGCTFFEPDFHINGRDWLEDELANYDEENLNTEDEKHD